MIDSAPRASLLVLALFAATATLTACGDDSSTTGGGGSGGEGATTSSSSTGTSTSTTTGGTSTTSGGTGGNGTGGNGTGGNGTGGNGAGGGEPAACSDDAQVEDSFAFDAQLEVDGGHYVCVVEGIDESSPIIETSLFCIQGDIAFTVTLSYAPVPALTGAFPLAAGQEVTVDATSTDVEEPPVAVGYVVRNAADDSLLFAWIDSFDFNPPGADDGWAAPLTFSEESGVCTPDEDGDERRALVVDVENGSSEVIFSEHIGVVESLPETFEVRVTQNTYNPDLEGSFNSHYRFAILAPGLTIPE